eukprot:XP_011616236.1 PREDICTED: uncharacterized protein LOC105418449 [Takifugu rubripes]
MNSTVFSGPYSRYIYSGAVRDRWCRNAGPSSHVALLPKPRFSRPLKPPSYEIHQQTRGSAEMLAIEQGMEPPGYIPPPSYKRVPPPRAVSVNHNEIANLRQVVHGWNIMEITVYRIENRSMLDTKSNQIKHVRYQGSALNSDSRKATFNDNDGSIRWCNRAINKKSDSAAPEQARSQFLPSSILGKPPPPPCKPANQGVSETVADTKKVEPPEQPDKDKSKNLKKRLSETIFCLVSVPVTPQLIIRDQNNNNEKSPDPADSPSDNKTGHLTNQSLQSTSSAEAELQALTGSISSSKASSRASSKMFKKVPCRPPKINHYKEMKLLGTWPANQYRDQETQTSPEVEKPVSENAEAQDPGPPSSEVPADNSAVVGTAFSFPIKGVKSLKLSSNSAFSLTSTFINQLNKSTAQQPAVTPSGNTEESKPAPVIGTEALEQLLRKPVSQRPWDAVKELETIQKEVQNQQQHQESKQPSVDKCIEDLNEAYKDILELGTASNKVTNGSVQIPERIKISLTSQPLNKPSSLRRSAVSWSVDPEYREVKSAFSRPATKSVTFSKQLREELPADLVESLCVDENIPPEPGDPEATEKQGATDALTNAEFGEKVSSTSGPDEAVVDKHTAKVDFECEAEAVQVLNKLAISPGRVAVERLARMREVDIMYRVRRLSIKSTDSGEGDGEADALEEAPPSPQRDKDTNEEVTPSQQVSTETVGQESSLTEPHDPSQVEAV